MAGNRLSVAYSMIIGFLNPIFKPKQKIMNNSDDTCPLISAVYPSRTHCIGYWVWATSLLKPKCISAAASIIPYSKIKFLFSREQYEYMERAVL
jgi:hypothetical protein